MTEIRTVRLPYRDVERRKVLGLMLGLPRSIYWSKFTCEEMQEIALKRGLLKEVKDERAEEK